LDSLKAFVKARPDLQTPVFACASAGAAHLQEATMSLWMHLLSEAAAVKLSEAHISKGELAAALNDTPSVREPIRQIALAVFDDGPPPSTVGWKDIYRRLGIQPVGSALRPRICVVDYYFGLAIEARAIERAERIEGVP
jgi:hypothetical protein